jgi:hypothetical protein
VRLYPLAKYKVYYLIENGISTICVCHYKSLIVYTLKKQAVEKNGSSIYDLHYMDIRKPFTYFVRKMGKNQFEMLEITDLTKNKTKIGKCNWLKFTM